MKCLKGILWWLTSGSGGSNLNRWDARWFRDLLNARHLRTIICNLFFPLDWLTMACFLYSRPRKLPELWSLFCNYAIGDRKLRLSSSDSVVLPLLVPKLSTGNLSSAVCDNQIMPIECQTFCAAENVICHVSDSREGEDIIHFDWWRLKVWKISVLLTVFSKNSGT